MRITESMPSHQSGSFESHLFLKIAIGLAIATSLGSDLALAGGRDYSASVFEPRWVTDAGKIQAGKAFAINLDGCSDPLLVSALHLFGPSGGLLPKQLEAVDLKRRVLKIELRSIAKPEDEISFKATSVTPDGAVVARPMTGIGDFVSFAAPESMRRFAFKVVTRPPAIGQRLLVVTSVFGSVRPSFVFEAEVRGFQNGYLVYEFITPGFKPQATSGAPVLNLEGQVVAVNLGGSAGRNGETYGFANPASAWANALKGTCGVHK